MPEASRRQPDRAPPLDAAALAAFGRLLDEGMELDPSQVEPWLASLKDADPALVAHLRVALARRGSARAVGFLAAGPRLAADALLDGQAAVGDLVGPYRLLRELGRGGMGTVWLAERADGTFKRQVALKLPRLAWGAGLAARMRRERDIGAMLEHPGIARLYDAGVDARGRPFLALEYVDGQPVDAWCDAHAPTVRERLGVFLQIAEAVAAAHAALVVHRDLKPSNVLVTAVGQVRLLDFGIAKLLLESDAGATALTQEQGAPMTLRYAAPEQIERGPVTVSCDIWSLGVLLYELLTHRHPFAARADTAALLQAAILEGDAVPASQAVEDRRLARELRGDLDAILAKVLQRDVHRRYRTAHELAQDIGRHLAGRPVEAQRASVFYRARKTIARHRYAFGAAAAVVIAVLGAGAVWVEQARASERQAARTRLVAAFVSEIMLAEGRQAPASAPASGAADHGFIDRGAQLIQSRFAGEPDLQAQLFGVVGRVYADLGADTLAIDYANRQIALLDGLPDQQAQRVRALLLLAEAAFREERIPEAEARAREAVDLSTFDAGVRLEAMSLLAQLQFENGEIEAARSSALTAQRYASSAGAPPSVGLVRLFGVQLKLMNHDNRFDQSAPLFQRAVAMALALEGPQSPAAIDLRIDRARVLTEARRPVEAKALMGLAIAALEGRGEAGRIRAAIESAREWSLLYSSDDATRAEAMQVVQSSRDLVASHAQAVPPIVQARLDFFLASMYLDWTDVEHAQQWLTACAPILEASALNLSTRRDLVIQEARLATYLGQYDRAEAAWRQALALNRQRGFDRSMRAAQDWVGISSLLSMKGEYARALAVLDEAPPFESLAGDATFPQLGGILMRVARARVHLDEGDARGALAALPPREELTPAERRAMRIQPVYGEALCTGGRPAEGYPLLQDALRLAADEETYRLDPDIARIRAVAGLCALTLGRRPEAAADATIVREALDAAPFVGPYYRLPLVRLERALHIR